MKKVTVRLTIFDEHRCDDSVKIEVSRDLKDKELMDMVKDFFDRDWQLFHHQALKVNQERKSYFERAFSRKNAD